MKLDHMFLYHTEYLSTPSMLLEYSEYMSHDVLRVYVLKSTR
jgi:hypothetical protein